MLRLYKAKFVIYYKQFFFVCHSIYTTHGLEIKFLKTSLYDENTIRKSESYIFLKALKVSFFLLFSFSLYNFCSFLCIFFCLLFLPFFCHFFCIYHFFPFSFVPSFSRFSFTFLISIFLFFPSFPFLLFVLSCFLISFYFSPYYSFFLPCFISLFPL